MTDQTNRDIAQRYGEAWNRHDLEAILALQTTDIAFQLHSAGFEEVTGEALVRQFAYFFDAWRDLYFHTVRLDVSGDLIVHEFEITGTLTKPFPLGEVAAQPTARELRFPGMDVIRVRDGLVCRKDTYLDALTLKAQLETVHEPRVQAPLRPTPA